LFHAKIIHRIRLQIKTEPYKWSNFILSNIKTLEWQNAKLLQNNNYYYAAKQPNWPVWPSPVFKLGKKLQHVGNTTHS